MPRTHAPPGRAGPAGPAAQRRRPGLARRAACLAGAIAGTLALGVAAAPSALGQPAQGQASQSARELSVVIESVSPQWATPDHKVTVTGTVTNGTATAQQGLYVQLRSSSAPLGNRTDLGLYAAGKYLADIAQGPAVPLPRTIPPGGEVRWQATLQPSVVGMMAFGVYPLAAQVVTGVGAPLATDRTFLPFWPGHGTSSRPRPLSIAWVWPLIDRPYQVACPGLFSNALAGRLGSGGRLDRMLAAGASYSAAAHLTWAIDPALVQNVHTMTRPYQVGGFPDCDDTKSLPPSGAARSWLRDLSRATAGQQVFLTPYGDTDLAALSHAGPDGDLRRAFDIRWIGQQILHLPTAGDIAWPDDGLADSSVLGNLAASGIKTVVLDSTVMPPNPLPSYTPSAQASVATSFGTPLNVLLADNGITQILRSGASTRPGTAFAAGQRFLAETAMIAAESPQLARSLVVAPPRRWNPSPGLPADLLSETVQAPWLKPTSLAALGAVKHPTGRVPRKQPPDRQRNQGELSASYLRQVAGLDQAARVQGSIFVPKYPGYLGTSLAALESSAWRGGNNATRVRQSLITRVSRYLTAQGRKVSIIDRGQITLGGSSGKVPISITNRLPGTVRVQLHARVPPDHRLTVGSFDNKVSIPSGKTVTIRLPVHAPTVGVTYVTLGLLAPDGKPLPGTLVRLSVHATRFGTLALVIICAALAVFVLTAFARAVRRARRDGRGAGESGPPAPDPPGPETATGSVMSGDDLAHDHPPEDPDEYADARGRASR